MALSVACRQNVSPPAQLPQSAEQCQASRAQLIQLLESLPKEGLALRGRSDLPVASLGGVIGGGRVVDVGGDALLLEGRPLPGASTEQRLVALGKLLSEGAEPTPEAPGVPRPLIYLALAGATDVRTLRSYLDVVPRSYDVHLVFQSPAPKPSLQTDAKASISERLLSESDLGTRLELSKEGFGKYARCAPVHDAVESVQAGDPGARWPALRSALLSALPQCQCGDLDADPLRELLMAEQRAGAAAVGSIPFDFMRDERCGASFGVSPVQKVVSDIQAFDEEFAGEYGHESVDFAQVVTNDRLLGYLCPALPGETLAALQRARHTFFWKVRGVERCQAWQFEPLASGSPMGKWRRVGSYSGAPLAVHYWQGAEEIRLYGPIPDEASKPTDEHGWACDQEFRMRGIDSQSIQLEAGRWFFDEDACQKASEDEGAFSGCMAALAGGPAEVPPAVPATFPAVGDGAPEAAP